MRNALGRLSVAGGSFQRPARNAVQRAVVVSMDEGFPASSGCCPGLTLLKEVRSWYSVVWR